MTNENIPAIDLELHSLADTQRLASLIAATFKPPCTIALEGTLGAGKTQLVRYFATLLGVQADTVTSPTYVLMQVYASVPVVYHIDAYRLKSVEEFIDLGVEELYEQPIFLWIEWASRISEGLPDSYLQIQLDPTGLESRHCRIAWRGPDRPDEWKNIISRWQDIARA